MVGQRYGKVTPRFWAPKANYTTSYETVAFENHTSCECVKMAPNSIEHDSIGSVISRPLVQQSIQPYSRNSMMYYIVITIAIVIGIGILVVILKCMYINPSRPVQN